MSTKPKDIPSTMPDQGPHKPLRHVNPTDKPVPSMMKKQEDQAKQAEAKAQDVTKETLDVPALMRERAERDESKAIGGAERRHSHNHVIALDGSANSNAAFRWANKNLPKQDRFILYSGLRHVPYVEGPLEGVDLEARERMLDKVRKERRQLLNKYEKECEDTGVSVLKT